MPRTQHETPLRLGPYYTKGIRFRETAKAIEETSPHSVLNIGCQYGYLELVLPDEMRVLSIDVLPDALEMAKAVNAGKPNREFKLLDLFDLPRTVPAASFGAVVMSEVTEHLEDDLAAMHVAKDCLRPGGTLFLTVPSLTRFPNRLRRLMGKKPTYMTPNHLREYTVESGRELAERAGFEVQRIVGLDFRLPNDVFMRRFVPIDFPPRHWLATRWPGIATYVLYVCRKPEGGG
ncbi:MAG: class I SAM-dependent methyltransferase [Dehalococcoidia bacterium]